MWWGKGSLHHAARLNGINSATPNTKRDSHQPGTTAAGANAQMAYQGQTWLTAENKTAAMVAMTAFCRLVMVGDQNETASQ